MRMVRDKILIKPFEAESITEGGLYVPDSCKEVSNKVKIVMVGDGTKDKPMKLKEGQTGYKVYSNGEATWCQEVEYKGEKHYIIPQDAILATD